MASREINLIDNRPKIPESEIKLRRQVMFLSPVVAIIFTIILVVIMSFSFYLSKNLENVESSLLEEKNRISALSKNESIFVHLKQKAMALSQIFKNRNPYSDLYIFFKGLENDKTSIKSLQLNETGESVMQVHLADSENINRFTETLLSEAEKKFYQIVIGSVTFAGNNYALEFTVNTRNKGKL